MQPNRQNWRGLQMAAGGAVLALFLLPILWAKIPQLGLHLLPPCLVNRLLGLPCPTCGTTRAALALASGDWLLALQWNPLFVLAYFLGIMGAGAAMIAAALSQPWSSRRIDFHLSKARWWITAAVVVNWLYLLWRGRF